MPPSFLCHVRHSQKIRITPRQHFAPVRSALPAAVSVAKRLFEMVERELLTARECRLQSAKGFVGIKQRDAQRAGDRGRLRARPIGAQRLQPVLTSL